MKSSSPLHTLIRHLQVRRPILTAECEALEPAQVADMGDLLGVCIDTASAGSGTRACRLAEGSPVSRDKRVMLRILAGIAAMMLAMLVGTEWYIQTEGFEQAALEAVQSR